MASVKYSKVPESAPAPNSLIGASGQAGLTWFHLVMAPWAAGSQIFFSSSTVICLRKLFFGLTTTVSASKATGISMYSTPAAVQSAISLAVIVREALEKSVSSRQNFLKPPPVPETPTVTLTTFFLAFWKSSATASVIGYTVDEPSILMTCAMADCAPIRATPATARAETSLEYLSMG